MVQYETKKGFVKYVCPGPEGFKSWYACFPVDLTQRLAERMENAVQPAPMDHEDSNQHFKAHLNQAANESKFNQARNRAKRFLMRFMLIRWIEKNWTIA